VPIELNDVSVVDHTLFCTKRNLKKYPNGTHAEAIPIIEYENVIFFQERG